MVTRPAVSLFTERKSGKFYAVVLRCGFQHGGRTCDDAETGGCSAPATAEALLSSDAPGGIRTHDLRLRRPTLYPAELQAPAEECPMINVE